MSNAFDLCSAVLQTTDGVVVRVHVQPKARRAQLVGMHSDRLKVAVTDPPDRDKANAAVLRLLADSNRLPLSSVELLRGSTNRTKDVLLRGQACADIADRLRHLLAGSLR